MNSMNTERSCKGNVGMILDRALCALQPATSLEFRVEPLPEACPIEHGYPARVTMFEHEFLFCVIEHEHLNKFRELQLLLNKDKTPYPLLLVTTYVTAEAAERLQEGGIQFIDTVGNAFVNQPPVLILVKGNRPGKQYGANRTAHMYKGVGLKLMYALLCRPELAGRPYRELAEITGIALGSVKNTMTELAAKGYIVEAGMQKKRLLKRKELFERWAEAYPDNLKPKLVMGRFRGVDNWWRDIRLDPGIAQWGGEVAAAKITGYLKPETVTLYANKDRLPELVIGNRLQKDPQGNIEILNRFWDMEAVADKRETVHPFLIYADLLAIGDERTLETTRMIYENYLEGCFRQD
ncbi:hypothetical protein FGF68_05935 [Prosthecochloris vibrioformis]|uniref:Uncharacterized protein n=2 Tax=Prosthecochloris vibrioformis TaxID=1098 RepID=A0A5C4S0M8_PROVB|nr:hypothetical protein FGF68_05935 [Prosthecochloris vibrioformis]